MKSSAHIVMLDRRRRRAWLQPRSPRRATSAV